MSTSKSNNSAGVADFSLCYNCLTEREFYHFNENSTWMSIQPRVLNKTGHTYKYYRYHLPLERQAIENIFISSMPAKCTRLYTSSDRTQLILILYFRPWSCCGQMWGKIRWWIKSCTDDHMNEYPKYIPILKDQNFNA